MIFQTNNQLNCFLIFIFLGFVFGLIFNVINILILNNFQKKLIKTIKNTLFFTLFSCFYIIFINIFNIGEFSLTLTLGYLLGFFWLVLSTKKSVVFLQEKWYNIFNKFKKVENERKRK